MNCIKFFLNPKDADELIFSYLDNKILKNIKKNENLFIVDLESVSLFNSYGLNILSNDETKYKKHRFFF